MEIHTIIDKLKEVQDMIDGAECRDDLDGIKGYIDDEIINKLLIEGEEKQAEIDNLQIKIEELEDELYG